MIFFRRDGPQKNSHQSNNVLDEFRFERLLLRLIEDDYMSAHEISDEINQLGTESEEPIVVSKNQRADTMK